METAYSTYIRAVIDAREGLKLATADAVIHFLMQELNIYGVDRDKLIDALVDAGAVKASV